MNKFLTADEVASDAPLAASATAEPMWSRWAVPVLLALQAGLLAYGAAVHSPTYNEPAHLVAGISYWRFGRFDVFRVNPPLVRVVAAIPVMLAGWDMDWKDFRDGPGERPEMGMGATFCEVNGRRTIWLMTIARWCCIPFSLLGGYICYRWGRELYGSASGILSLTLWCFCPNIIAHGQLITCDAAATSLCVTACYSFWHWLRAPSWRYTAFSGLVLGVAELAKTTLVILFLLWPLLWLIYRWPDRRAMTGKDWLRELGMLFTCVLIGIYVINLGYGFECSFKHLGEYKFVSRSFTGIADLDEAHLGGNRFADSWLGNLPVPLPKNYLSGIDLQRKDFESYGHEFYLGGVWSKTGWWYYYLYALAIKMPLGTWLLLPTSIGIRLVNGPPAKLRDVLFLLSPSVVILTFVSYQTGMNEHMRYVLPVLPFLYIYISGSMKVLKSISHDHAESFPKRTANVFFACMVVLSIIWSTSSSLMCYPHSLSYFNESIGGARNGWKHLAFSNIDWGQDLIYLKKWSDDHQDAKPLKMALFGTINPKHVGIEGEIIVPSEGEYQLTPGHYAFSTTILSGFGQLHNSERLRTEFQQLSTYETIGGSIVVFVKD